MTRRNGWLWLLAAFFWTVLIGAFAWHESNENFDNIVQFATIEARARFSKDLVYRRWAAHHGGVYVPVDESTPPSPFLRDSPERDLQTPSGRHLTLINPAYMTRQVYELDAATSGVVSHITSLNPIRPENAPDLWEKQALQAFESKPRSSDEFISHLGGDSLRVMFPLRIEESCLACHDAADDKVGDIRGGISLSVPLAPYLAIYQDTLPKQAAYHFGVWFMGLFGLLLFRAIINRQFSVRDTALKKSQTAENALKKQQVVFEQVQSLGRVGGWDLNLQSGELAWTQEMYEMLRVPPGTEMSYQRFLESVHPEDRSFVDYMWQAALKGAPYDIEHRVVIDGNVRWVREKADLQFDANGVAVSALGFTQDITARKQEEMVLSAQLRLVEYASGHTVHELLSRFLDEVEILTNSQIGFYHFVDSDERTLTMQAWSTNTRTHMCQTHPESFHFSIDKAGVWVDCVRERAPVIHNDYARLAHKRGLPPGHAPIQRELLVPVFRDHKIVAILAVGNKPTDYDEGDVRTVQRLADLAWETVLRRQAEESLRENEARIRLLFENMTSGFALHEMLYDEFGRPVDYRFLEVNPAFEKLTGLKASAIVGKTVLQLLPDTEPYWIETYGEVATTGTPKAIMNYARAFGKYFDTYAFTPIRGQFAVVFNDVTEQKRVELALRESEERFHRMFQDHNAIMLLVDPVTGRIVDANTAACRFYGYHPEQLKTMGIDLLNVESPNEIGHAMEQALSAKANYFEFRHRLASGEIRHVEVHSSPVQLRGHTLLFSIMHDISERKRSKKALADSEKKYRVLFEDAAHGSAVADAESGIILDCNRTLARMLGRRVEEIVGQSQSFLHPPGLAKDGLTRNFREQQDRADAEVIEDQLITKSGELVYVEIMATQLEIDGRNVIHGFFYDITERKRLMEEFHRSAQLAALGTIAAGVAHEINNPMQGILNFAALIHKAPENVERVGSLAERILKEGERVASLTRNLLHYSRDTRGELICVDIVALIIEAISLVRVKIDQQTIIIDVDMPQEPESILVHPQGIQQIVVNLLDNACDALDNVFSDSRTKKIRVSGRVMPTEPHSSFVLQVEDNGIGIPAENLARVRDAFFSTKLSQQGTGLGLAIIGDIIAKHDGTMSIESVEGEFTLISVALPMRTCLPNSPAPG